jgi:hypothetical protein
MELSMHKWTVGAAFIAPLAAGLLATAALAETKPAQAQAPDAGRNEKVCENIVVTGSRLATKRFCGTRAEWEDRRRQDREAVEAAQRSPCVLQRNVMTGRPTC